VIRVTSAVVVAVLAAALVSTAIAGAEENYQFEYNAADQTAARAVALRRPDLALGWKGGFKKVRKSDLAPLTCRNYHPKVSDLVITGAADAVWQNAGTGSYAESSVNVLQTADMVRLDWQRSMAPAAARDCLASDLAKNLDPSQKLTSFKKVGFPRTASYRVAFEGTVVENHVPVTIYLVGVGRNRTELSLFLVGPKGVLTKTDAADIARRLISRAQA
jgi:hypothetical protein